MQTTSFLLSNLHCSSCVSTIEGALFALNPKPLSVSFSIVTSLVTVRHEYSLPLTIIRNTLEDDGFDVCSVLVDGMPQDIFDNLQEGQGVWERVSSEWRSRLNMEGCQGRYIRMKERHIEVCTLCQSDGGRVAGHKHLPSATRSADAQTQLTRAIHDDLEKSADSGSFADGNNVEISNARVNTKDDEQPAPPLVVIDKGENQETWRATLAVGGMTCASCVNTIKEEVEKKDWVKKIDINLIMGSATIEFVGEYHAYELAGLIEDLGFEAALDNVTNSQELQRPDLRSREARLEEIQSKAPGRTVEIKVSGMFCQLCPERILQSLDTLADRGVHIEKPLSIKDPILKISYTPSAPEFTIRLIIACLSEVDAALVPSIYHPPTLEERSRLLYAQERRWILRRVILCIVAAIPTFIIGVVFMSLVPSSNASRQFLEKPWSARVSRAQWALFIMATPVYFFAADIFHVRMLKEVRAMWRRGSKVPLLQRFYRFGSMDMLISLGTSIAYISSVAQLINACIYPSLMPMAGSLYFDSVVFLTMFLLIGRLIEAYSKSRTGDAVGLLGKLRPTKAILIDKDNDSESEVEVDFLEYGDVVRVLHGASPPIDGVLTEGDGIFDESSLTGESKLVKKLVGDQVFSGTVNNGGPISIRITGVAGTSMIDQIIRVVREGQTRHAPIERIASILTSYFVPLVTLFAVCTWIVWLSLGLSGTLPEDYLDTASPGGWATWSLQFAIAVFVVACPCGLGLAAPTALFVGGGLAAQHGILVKGGGEAFENASRLDCIVFDKTGTLTVGGEPTVTNYKLLPHGGDPVSSEDEMEVFSMIQNLEEKSSHPIAKAIVSFCKNQRQERQEAQNVTEIAGKGMKGSFKSEKRNQPTHLIVGNEALMADYHVEISSEISTILDAWKSQGESIALVAVTSAAAQSSWHLSALFGVSDEIRPESASVVKALQQRGTAVWMLSGDNYASACAIGAQVGIGSENIIAGVLPSQKADKIQYLQKSLKARDGSGKELMQKRALVAMVGDGINDSPALTAADVGIAIGSGSDIAISSAEFVLVSSNLHALITLLDLSKTVFNRIMFNFGWAAIYNLIGVPIAAGMLYPVVSNGSHVRLDPVWASLAMALSSISVVCSSLALRSRIPWVGFKGHKR